MSSVHATYKDSLHHASLSSEKAALQYARVYIKQDPETAKMMLDRIVTKVAKPDIEVYDLLLSYAHLTAVPDTINKYTKLSFQYATKTSKEAQQYFIFRDFIFRHNRNKDTVYSASLKLLHQFESQSDLYLKQRAYFYLCAAFSNAFSNASQIDSVKKYAQQYLKYSASTDLFNRLEVQRVVCNAQINGGGNEVLFQQLQNLLKEAEKYDLFLTQAQLLFNFGKLYSRNSDSLRSIQYLKKSVALIKLHYHTSFDLELVKSYIQLGTELSRQQIHKEALSAYDSAFLYDNQQRFSLFIYSGKASITLKLKDWENAKIYLNNAILLAKQNKDDYNLALSWVNMAYLEKETGNFSKALAILEENPELINDQRLKEGALIVKMECYEKLADYKMAYKTLLELDTIRQDQSLEKLKLAQAKFDQDLKMNEEIAEKELANSQLEKQSIRLKIQQGILIILGLFFLIGTLVVVRNYKAKLRTKEMFVKQLEVEADFQDRSFHERLNDLETNYKKNIADELHDTTLSALSGIRLMTEALELTAVRDKLSIKDQVSEIVKILQTTHSNLRHYVDNLRSGSRTTLYQSDMLNDMEDYLASMLNAKGILLNMDYHIGNSHKLLNDNIQIGLTRILREIVNNIIVHSKATMCKIKIDWTSDVFSVSVFDNGTGIEIVNLKNGRGMHSLATRVNKLGGTINYVTKPNEGTIVDISFPL